MLFPAPSPGKRAFINYSPQLKILATTQMNQVSRLFENVIILSKIIILISVSIDLTLDVNNDIR